MGIQRVGPFIEFLADENGLRTLARVASVQVIAETDPLGQEVFITVANRTFRVGATLEEARQVLLAEAQKPAYTSAKQASKTDKGTRGAHLQAST